MQKFKVTPDDGDAYTVTATSRDISRWEKTNKGASFAKLQEDMRMSDLYKIAWGASVRQDMFSGTLADFESTCDISTDDTRDDDEAEDPTPSAV